MKYPKLWNGTSPLGEALVRSLQRVRSPFLSAKAGDVHANKMGGRSEVFQGDDIGLMTLGALGDHLPFGPVPLEGPYRIAGTRNPRLSFKTLGTLSGPELRINNRAGYLGAGKLSVWERTNKLTDTDRVDSILHTRNGRVFSLAIQDDPPKAGPGGVIDFTGATSLTNTTPGALVGDPLQWVDGFSGYVYLGDIAYQPVYWRKSGENYDRVDIPGVWVPGVNRPSTESLQVFRVEPTSLLVFNPSIPVDETSTSEEVYRRSRMVLSRDNGASWTILPSGELISRMEPPSSSGLFLFGQELVRFAWNMWVLALSDGSWLVAGVTRLYSMGADINGRGRTLSLFRVTETTSSLLLSVPTTADEEVAGFVLGDEPVLQLRFGPSATGTILRFSPDLAEVAVLDLPWVGSHHGAVLPLSPTEMMVPAYDGEAYRLFLSRDGGETWVPGGIIDREAPPPTTTERVMRRYSRVELVRRNGRAAPTFPGQPWVGDSRITPPWEA